MLTKQQKQKWIDALRSGNYKQGQGALHWKESNTFCCLGVLCDVLGAELSYREVGGIVTANSIKGIQTVEVYSHLNNLLFDTALIPHFEKSVYSLTSMNDRHDKNFLEISDWIEQNIETQ